MSHVVLRSLTKRYGDFAAVNAIDLEIPRGSFTTLLGPSGCGKTTTLRMIGGFIQPTSGDVLISGKSQQGIPPEKRPTSLVFQDYALFPHMTVFDNVAYGLRAHRINKAEVPSRVMEALSLVGMEDYVKRYPRELSGGQQQRVALARSLVLKPEVLLMDEPLSNLDAKLRVSIRNEIKELQKRLGITTIYVTHDQEEALAMSDQIAVMSDGIIKQVGDPQSIYYSPVDRFVADFIGEANLIEARVASIDDGNIVFALDQGHSLSVSRSNMRQPINAGDNVTLVLRPEAIVLSQDSTDSFPLSGDIVQAAFLGSIVRYWVKLGSNVVVVNQTKDPFTPILQGRVSVRINTEWMHVLPL